MTVNQKTGNQIQEMRLLKYLKMLNLENLLKKQIQKQEKKMDMLAVTQLILRNVLKK